MTGISYPGTESTAGIITIIVPGQNQPSIVVFRMEILQGIWKKYLSSVNPKVLLIVKSMYLNPFLNS